MPRSTRQRRWPRPQLRAIPVNDMTGASRDASDTVAGALAGTGIQGALTRARPPPASRSAA